MVNNNNDDNIRILCLSFHRLNFMCLRKQNLQEKSRASVNRLANLMMQRVFRLITMSIRIFTPEIEANLCASFMEMCGMFKLHGNIVIFKFLRFSKTRILKFKSQLTFVFFTSVNHLSKPLRKQKFTSMSSKGCGLWFVIGACRPILCSEIQRSLLGLVTIIDSSKK